MRICALLLGFGAIDGDDDASTIHDASSIDGGDAKIHEASTHRPAATTCSMTRPAGNPIFDAGGQCAIDVDCDAGINGRCIGVFECACCDGCPTNRCSYDSCFSDDACSGTACACREDFPSAGNMGDFCSAGNCRVDSDCPGSVCSPSFISGCTTPGFYCHTQSDECLNDSDCNTGICGWVELLQRWTCAHECIDG